MIDDHLVSAFLIPKSFFDVDVKRIANDLSKSEAKDPTICRQYASLQRAQVQMLQHVERHEIFQTLGEISGRIKDEAVFQKTDHRRKRLRRNGLKTPVRMVAPELTHLVPLSAESAPRHGDQRFRPVQIVCEIPLRRHRAVREKATKHLDMSFRDRSKEHGTAALVFPNQFCHSRGMIPADRQPIMRRYRLVVQADEKGILICAPLHTAGLSPHEQTAGGRIAFTACKKRHEGTQPVGILPRELLKLHVFHPDRVIICE